MTAPMGEPWVFVTSSTHHEPATGPGAWLPLLRKLHAAGWEHFRYGKDDAVEHVWFRNRLARNQQKLSLDEGVASIEIDGVTMSAAGLTADQTDLFLLLLGAFRSAPTAQWQRSEVASEAVTADVRR